MSAHPIWPSTSSEFALWAQLICAWAVASYVIAPDVLDERTQRRGGRLLVALAIIAAAFLGAWLPAPGTSAAARIALSGGLGTLVGVGALVRQTLAHSIEGTRRLAEWELALNSVSVLVMALAIGLGRVGVPSTATIARSGTVAAICCVIAAIVLVLRCGTYIVRGVLDKAGAVPLEGATPPQTAQALSRGRHIGNLERLVLVSVLAVGSYEALGFLIAAKGLIRARELEDRNVAEYFILGSLASVAVALVVGMLLRVSVGYFWRS